VTRYLCACGSTSVRSAKRSTRCSNSFAENGARRRIAQENRPNVNDWNDQFLVAAFARAFRCLRSVREIACRGEANDAAVLTPALIALTLRHLWIGRAPGEQRPGIQAVRLVQK
jgi:hypothetical protein